MEEVKPQPFSIAHIAGPVLACVICLLVGVTLGELFIGTAEKEKKPIPQAVKANVGCPVVFQDGSNHVEGVVMDKVEGFVLVRIEPEYVSPTNPPKEKWIALNEIEVVLPYPTKQRVHDKYAHLPIVIFKSGFDGELHEGRLIKNRGRMSHVYDIQEKSEKWILDTTIVDRPTGSTGSIGDAEPTPEPQKGVTNEDPAKENP